MYKCSMEEFQSQSAETDTHIHTHGHEQTGTERAESVNQSWMRGAVSCVLLAKLKRVRVCESATSMVSQQAGSHSSNDNRSICLHSVSFNKPDKTSQSIYLCFLLMIRNQKCTRKQEMTPHGDMSQLHTFFKKVLNLYNPFERTFLSEITFCSNRCLSGL